MKKGLFIVVMILFAGCTAINHSIVREFDANQTIHYSHISEINDSEIGNYSIYFESGDKIPVIVNIKSGIASADNEKIYLTLDKRLYFRIFIPAGFNDMNDAQKKDAAKDIMVYTSLDNIHWAPSSDMQAIKKTLGMKKGSITIGAGITKDSGVNIGVDIIAQ
ncbi:MAG TPA: hypothetical protein VIS94_01260 [Desulfomonilia bacterium]